MYIHLNVLNICVLWTFYYTSWSWFYNVVLRLLEAAVNLCLCYAMCFRTYYIELQLMCVSFCRLFVSFKLHAVSITRRFQYMPFPVSHYPPFPLLAVSSSHVLHAVSFTRAFHHYHCYTRIPLHTVSITRAFSVPSSTWNHNNKLFIITLIYDQKT